MSYAISGSGTHAVSAGVEQLYLDITTTPANAGEGRANPTSKYDIGLIRAGDGTGWWSAVPIVGGPQWIGLPHGTTEIAYVVFNTGEVEVTEVALPNPFTGPSGAAGAVGPAGPAGPAGSAGLYSAVVMVADQKASGTDGGNFTSGAWRTRDLNTLLADSGGIAAIVANQLQLPAGTYDVNISCPAVNCNRHQARLRNVTDGATLLTGTSQFSEIGSTTPGDTRSVIQGRFTLAAAKSLEIQHQCQTTQNVNGFGVDSGFGNVETYTLGTFYKV